MKRREFITLLGGAGAAWPFGSRLEGAERLRRIVFLHGISENDPEAGARIVAFRQGLATFGWTENRNVQIEHRFAGGDFGRIQALTTELVGSAPDLIVASSAPVLAALKEATRTVPIVFCLVIDPVGMGFVISLARPGGNITGFTPFEFPIIGKWLDTLKEIDPGIRRIAFMFNPQTAPYYPVLLREFRAGAASLAAELLATPVRDEAEMGEAITALCA